MKNQWYVKNIVRGDFYAEGIINGKHMMKYIKNQHCKACAINNLLTIYGGTVDTRGLHHYGMCGNYAKLVALSNRGGEEVCEDCR